MIGDHQIQKRFAGFLRVRSCGAPTPLSQPFGFRFGFQVEQAGESLKVIFSRNGSRSRKGRAVRPECERRMLTGFPIRLRCHRKFVESPGRYNSARIWKNLIRSRRNGNRVSYTRKPRKNFPGPAESLICDVTLL